MVSLLSEDGDAAGGEGRAVLYFHGPHAIVRRQTDFLHAFGPVGPPAGHGRGRETRGDGKSGDHGDHRANVPSLGRIPGHAPGRRRRPGMEDLPRPRPAGTGPLRTLVQPHFSTGNAPVDARRKFVKQNYGRRRGGLPGPKRLRGLLGSGGRSPPLHPGSVVHHPARGPTGHDRPHLRVARRKNAGVGRVLEGNQNSGDRTVEGPRRLVRRLRSEAQLSSVQKRFLHQRHGHSAPVRTGLLWRRPPNAEILR
mmetsp:Transcript_15265/g.34199  ORF Transcript_15265/g.34199 Transcript_15265/m.34199 type:complete len:252 (+) Transcript_15265:370-1125(+)